MKSPLLNYVKVDLEETARQLRRIGDLLERWMAWQGIPGGMPASEELSAEVTYTDEEEDALREWKRKMGLIEELEEAEKEEK